MHDGGITFILTATGSTSGGTATTTFLDSAYNLDHCANIDLSHLTDACGNTAPGAHPTWVNGDLNRNNSAYREGDGVPHRLAVPALTDGQWFIELDYDFTKGGKYAFDRLTSLQLTQAANPCADTTCGTGPVNFAIPSGSSESTHPSVNLDALHVGGRVAPLNPTTEALMSAWVQGGSFLFPRASVPSPRSVPVAVTVRGNC